MKILVVSDTHYRTAAPISVIMRLNPDCVIHLGDMVADAKELQLVFPDINIIFVRGNNDFSNAPPEILTELYGKRIFLTHGHNYGVKSGVTRLADRANALGADYALFGHTHKPFDQTIGGVRLLNPSSYGYIVIDNKKAEVCKY